MSAAQENGVLGSTSNGNGVGTTYRGRSGETAQRRPEVAVGAAFAGGFLFALLLRRIRS